MKEGSPIVCNLNIKSVQFIQVSIRKERPITNTLILRSNETIKDTDDSHPV